MPRADRGRAVSDRGRKTYFAREAIKPRQTLYNKNVNYSALSYSLWKMFPVG